MIYQEFKRKYTEVTRQMQDYFETKQEFRIMLSNIIENRFKELTNSLKDYEIFELQRIICEIESINKNLDINEINKIIDKRINKQENNLNKNNNKTYSKHKLYKLRSLKLKKQ